MNSYFVVTSFQMVDFADLYLLVDYSLNFPCQILNSYHPSMTSLIDLVQCFVKHSGYLFASHGGVLLLGWPATGALLLTAV